METRPSVALRSEYDVLEYDVLDDDEYRALMDQSCWLVE